MSWLTPKLKHRIQIKRGVDSPNDDGGFDRSYTTLATVWAGIKEQSDYRTSYLAAVRGVKTEDVESHEFIVRRAGIMYFLGKSFSTGFGSGFNSIVDLNPLKSDYFIFLNSGSNVKGRLFRINRIKMDEYNKEYFKMKVTEIEEQGTGYQS